MKRSYFMLILFFLPTLSLSGQQIIVKSLWGDEVLEGVAIFNQSMNRSSITDSNGIASSYMFKATDTLFFQHPSYEGYSIPFKNIENNSIIFLERKTILIPEYVITASKQRENKKEVPYLVDIISSKDISKTTSINSADLLTLSGNIFVQKSQAGGGSPIIRGFEANRVLLVVDGVRMNNAIYRSGHLQNSLTIDNNILDRVEVIFGPSSVIYGSDALGGVVHYITKSPHLADTVGSTRFEANASIKDASATKSLKSHLDFNLGFQKVAFLSSITYSDYGELRMGKRRNPFLGDWGKQDSIAVRRNNSDILIDNPDKNLVPRSDFKQIDFLEKIIYKPGKQTDIILNFQYSTSTNINRQDQLNNKLENGNPEFTEWYYGPQDRLMTSLKIANRRTTRLYNRFEATLAYQNIEESRNTREYNNDTIYHQIENVQVGSATFDFFKQISTRASISYGLDLNYNYVGSDAHKKNIISGESLPAITRYPNLGTQTMATGAYMSYKRRLRPRLLSLVGLRMQYYSLNAQYGSFYNDLPEIFQNVNLETQAITSSLSFIINQARNINWNIIFSTGFRSPNLDDLAKIRLTSGKLTLPNAELIPEYTYNAELGLSKTFDGYIQFSGNYFFSYLTNFITRVPYSFEDGSDSLLFQGHYRTTYQNTNSTEGIIHGLSLNLVSDLNTNLSFRSTLNYTMGKNLTMNEPLAHIPPIFGKTRFNYEVKNLNFEVSFIYAGWKHISDMVTTSEDRKDEATEFGFPGWYTINVNTVYHLTRQVSLQFAIDNLTDNFYKPFASGVPAPGINFIGSLSFKIY